MPILISLFFSLGGITNAMVAFTSGVCFLFGGFFVYYIALKLLGRATANISLLFYFTNPILLRYAISGKEICLLTLLMLALVTFLLMFLEKNTNLIASGIGVILACMFLARYWTIVFMLPVGILIYATSKMENVSKLLFAFFSFLAVVSPWWVRNAYLTGNPLFTLNSIGVKSFLSGIPLADFFKNIDMINIGKVNMLAVLKRFLANLDFSYTGLLLLTRNFILSFFVIGFFCRFKKAAPSFVTFKHLVLVFMCLIFLLSGFSREIGEYLTMLIPFIIIIGVGFLFEMWHRLDIKRALFRKMVMPVFILVNMVPFCFALALPSVREDAVSKKNLLYLQSIIGKDKVVISDIPWKIAWEINRPCVWLPVEKEDFNRIIEAAKKQQTPLEFAYITRGVLNYPLSSDKNIWKRLYIEGIIPDDFYFEQGMLLPGKNLFLGLDKDLQAIKKRSRKYFLKHNG